MPNTKILKENGQEFYPVTHASLIVGMENQGRMDATYAWDGTGTPDITKIPAGVVVTYDGTDYTGTLAASADTAGRFYLVPSTTVTGEYDRYLTDATGNTITWKPAGTTAIPTPSILDNVTSTDTDKALSANQGKLLKDDLSQLEAKVTEFVDTVQSNDYTEVLIDAESKILESRDADGKKTIYTDLAIEGDVTGDFIDDERARITAEIDEAVNDGIGNYIKEIVSDDYTEVLIDAGGKLLESRDGNGKKTIYADIELKGEVTGDAIPEITVKPATDLIDAVVDAEEKTVEGTRKNGAKVFFGGIETTDEVPFTTSILYGKKWAVLGDSFTNSGGDNTPLTWGKYKGKLTVYPYIIGNRTGIEVIKFFEGGRTLAFPANPGTFVNSVCCPTMPYYYQNIPVDVDYITIYLGINDGHHAPGSGGGDGEDNTGDIPIGTITDNTTATYYGAWNVVLTWLRTNRPFAHIGILVSNGCDGMEYVTAQIEIAKKYGIPYLNLNGDERCPAMIRSLNPNLDATVKTIIDMTQAVDYPSNTHPNQSAHIYESTFIENFLKSL